MLALVEACSCSKVYKFKACVFCSEFLSRNLPFSWAMPKLAGAFKNWPTAENDLANFACFACLASLNNQLSITREML